MDFMKWLSSLDELLYELISWLVFFPLTLWRACVHPVRMMEYADRQLRLPDTTQYDDAISPPLFLALSLAAAHIGAIAAGEVDRLVANRHGLAGIITDDTSALMFRVLVFAIFPLMMSVRLVRIRRLALDRQTLRLPFYAQCYPASLFALGLSFGAILAGLPDYRAQLVGLALATGSIVYYIAIQTRWFAEQTDSSRLRAFASAGRAFTEALALLILAGFLFAS